MHLIISEKAITTIDVKKSLNHINISVNNDTITRMLKIEGMATITVKPKPYLSVCYKQLYLSFAIEYKD